MRRATGKASCIDLGQLAEKLRGNGDQFGNELAL
jgi:hypothetical protein